LAECATGLTTPSKIMMRGEFRDRMMQQLERLPACSQEALVLRYLEKLSVKETAVVLQITRGAAQMRIVRALEALRCLINDSTPESHL
jgi:RNA polymerase sigma factor (sigma-70 family)